MVATEKMDGPIGYDDFEKQMKDRGFSIDYDTKEATWADDEKVREKLDQLNDDTPLSVDESENNEVKFPPIPVQLRPWDAFETEQRYKGTKDDFKARITHKLLKIWIMWAQLRCSDELTNMLATECAHDTDEYKVKSTIIDIIDVLAKVLIDTDTREELKWLATTD
jgi:hypothetical protein